MKNRFLSLPPAAGAGRSAAGVDGDPVGLPSGRRPPQAPPALHRLRRRTRQRRPTGGFALRTLSHPVRHRLPPETNFLACDASVATPRFAVAPQRRTLPRATASLASRLTSVTLSYLEEADDRGNYLRKCESMSATAKWTLEIMTHRKCHSLKQIATESVTTAKPQG